MPRDVNSRIIRLADYFQPVACPICRDKPSRLVMVDPVTDEETSSSIPADGCPSCHTPIFRTYVIVLDDESRDA